MKISARGDAFLGAVLTLAVAGAYLISFPLFEGIELKFYDMRAKLRQNLAITDEVVLVAIDDDSIAQVGHWPWPRSRLAAMVDKLSGAGARVVGLDVPLSEEERNPGLSELRRLNELYNGMVASRTFTDRRRVFNVEFSSAITQLDSDSQLEASLRRAGNVVLPMSLAPGGKLGGQPEDLPDSVSSFTVSQPASGGAGDSRSVEGLAAGYPIARFASVCAGIGHAWRSPDFDGVLRREAPVLRYGGYYLPSYAVQLVRAYSGLPAREVSFVPGQELRIGRLAVPLDGADRMLITYNGPEQTFQYFSFQDVIDDKVSMDVFKGKIVIVGLTASGTAATYATPLATDFPAIEATANVVENILHRKFLLRPPWAARLELGALGLAGLFVMFLLPRFKALAGLIFSLALMVGITAAGTYLFVNGHWVKLAYPSILLALAYVASVAKRFFFTEKGGGAVEAPAAGAQARPKLEAAVAGAGLGGGAKKDAARRLAGGAARSALGRYEIERELGRGAMGIVYLGRDPKINRHVAIKAMVLEEGANASETKEIRERFFREAESAGTLNHPNIVRIFDAGEDREVAYIAMELLDGHDFTRYAVKEGLLPVLQVLDYIAIVADALDYAHAQGIVHRDIKPANIMLLKDGSIRVADFGIARITASSKTAVGTVLGTPSYMSPEQVSGKKVDGRSDLFSLTVALYELLTGQKPFQGGEGIGTLLFQIANDPHPDMLSMRLDIPKCLVPVVNQGLAKDPDQRYARGSLLAADLRACAAAIKAGRGDAAMPAPAAPAPQVQLPALEAGSRPRPPAATVAIELPRPAAVPPITLQAPPPAAEGPGRT
ncbi:MAG: serine/threonine-protein kinase [Elusimicrobiota bacterium]|jgi:serine/threonine-protein kinase